MIVLSSQHNMAVNNINASKVANSVAKEAGFTSFKNAVAELSPGINRENRSALLGAGNLVTNLTLKILQQDIFETQSPNKYEKFIQRFYKGELYGNTKEVVFDLATGVDNYNVNEFIPTKITAPKQEFFHINFLKPDGTLADNSFRWKKPITVLKVLWTQYFISGKLEEYVSKIIKDLKQVMTMKLYQLILDTIIAEAPSTNTGSLGVATNNFSAWVDEIFPAVEDMLFFSNKYNINPNSKYLHSAEKKDLIALMSIKTYNAYKHGTLSQLFNSKAADLSNILDESNIHIPERVLNIQTSDDIITKDASFGINDETVIIFDPEYFYFMRQIEQNEEQRFTTNLANQHTYHFWGVFTIAPQAKIFKYTNTNLNKSPSLVSVK